MIPLLSNEEIVKRRQIIQHAFADEFSPQQIKQAIALWDDVFHDSPTFISKIFQFVSQLSHKFGLPSRDRFKLMKCLMNSFNLLKYTDIIEPQSIITQAMTDDYVIFNAVLSETIAYLKQQFIEELPIFKQYLLEEIPNLSLAPQAQKALLTWCQLIDNEEILVIRENFNQQQMTDVIDLLYEELCGLFGAKQTDLLFSTVVDNCEKYPEAKHFSPHELL